MRLQRTVRLLETLRHLKLQQIIFQVWYRIRKRKQPTAPVVKTRELSQHQSWIIKPDTWEPGAAFTFLNESRSHTKNIDWCDSGALKLWTYNLHYFDYLQSESPGVDCDACKQIMAQWVASNQDITKDGWEPYPTSLRLVNWIKFALDNPSLEPDILESLAKQAQWLSGGLEYHILANHLFANAKAMVFVGVFFEGPAAEQWLAKGLSLVNTQLEEQILEDGGHYELTPMYHAILLEDMLDLYNLSRTYKSGIAESVRLNWENVTSKMFDWHIQMLHPDGDIGFFNDTALGIAASRASLTDYADRLGLGLDAPHTDHSQPSKLFMQTGYAALRQGDFAVLANVGLIGPRYQAGHAHADTLSCEVSVGLDRVLVNAGTSTYVKGALRVWQRSTAAHNTLELDGQNSSDVWDGHRVGRRAKSYDVQFAINDVVTTLSAKHDGYRFLAGSPVHSRSWQLSSSSLKIIDKVEGVYSTAVVRWLLHPSIEVLGGQRLKTPAGIVLAWSVDAGEVNVVPAHWYPEFGKQMDTQCIEVSMPSGKDQSVSFEVWEVK